MQFDLDDLRFFSSRMPYIPDTYRKGKMAAKLQFDGGDDVDTVKELEDAIEDIDNAMDNASSRGYDDKIKQNILNHSVEQTDYAVAKKEWSLHKKWADPAGGKCEVCGHNPIIYHFQIKNKHNHNKLICGSECILNYLHLEGYTKQELAKYLTRLRQRLKDRRFNSVEKELLDIWDKQDEVFHSLKKLVHKLPTGFDISKFSRRLYRFERVAGYRIKTSFSKYVANVRTMSRMLDRTYGTTELSKIPSKIQRKQKLNRQKITDQKKLELFIEFETQLKLLMKFGTPTEAYEMIMDDFKDHLRNLKDDIDEKRDGVLADISKVFGAKKRDLGSRSRMKDYVDSWCDRVQAKCTEEWAVYEAYLNDIDGMMSGRVRVPPSPSNKGEIYISQVLDGWGSWGGSLAVEQNVYKIIFKMSSIQYHAPTWSSTTIPKDSPLRKVKSLDGGTLYATLLDSVDRSEVPISDLSRVVSQYGNTAIVTAEFVFGHPKMMKRLLGDSTEFRKAIAVAEDAAQALLKQKKKDDAAAADAAVADASALAKEVQEFDDLISDAEKHMDPNNDWEKKFTADMKRKFKLVADMSPKQLLHLRRIADRSSVPQPTPAQNAATQAQQAPSGATSVDFNDFIEDCKTTMNVAREAGFVNSVQRRYSSWSRVSPRQGKWLMDIYLRDPSRTKPDHIT